MIILSTLIFFWSLKGYPVPWPGAFGRTTRKILKRESWIDFFFKFDRKNNVKFFK